MRSRFSGIAGAALAAVFGAAGAQGGTVPGSAPAGGAAPSAGMPAAASARPSSAPPAAAAKAAPTIAGIDLFATDPAAATPAKPSASPVARAGQAEVTPLARMPVVTMPAIAAPADLAAASGSAAKAGQGARDEFSLDPEPDVAIQPPPAPAAASTDGPASGTTPAYGSAAAPAGIPSNSSPSNSPAAANAAPVAPPASVVVTLPPANAALKAALDRRAAPELRGERRRERDALAAFYAAHDYVPLWSANGIATPAVAPVLARLAHAGDDALTLGTTPAALTAVGAPEAIADSELALSEAVVAYARQASGSRVDPHAIAPLIGFKPKLADAGEVLGATAAAGADAGDRLRAFNPSEPRYLALRDKLAQLRAAHAPTTAVIPAGTDLRIGMRDPRVPLIRARFSLDGTPDREPQAMRYDTEVAGAVADFQKANGLPASGVLTRRTVTALSGGRPSRLEGQLVANMEMWRWMPRELGADRVEVNIPDYIVTVFRADAPVSRNRVVVGKKDTPTPLFADALRLVIVNPVWNVPESIIKKEMLPKLEQDPDYLARLGYVVSEHHGRLAVRQPAGEKNALGQIKFLFPNDYAVYLHDTPSKSLFASARRAFSHGCVRVDQPFRFAQSALDGTKWNEARLRSLIGDKERPIALQKPLPIYLEYFTASVDETGHLALRDDVYDYVHRIASALGQES